MTIADLLKDILDTSKERVKTPISGAYIFAFIIWNWRPIALLLFEKTTITQKIIVINHEYCNLSAIIYPFLLGLFFTIVIPYLMSIIDIIMKPAKTWRLKNLYDSKKQVLINEILLVDNELELQDKKNRNKEKTDFEQQISELERRIELTNESHKAVVEDYENKLNDLLNINNSKSRQKKSESKGSETDFAETLIKSGLKSTEIEKIYLLPDSIEQAIEYKKIGYTVINFFKANSFIDDQNNEIHLTELGLNFKNWIKKNNIKFTHDIL